MWRGRTSDAAGAGARRRSTAAGQRGGGGVGSLLARCPRWPWAGVRTFFHFWPFRTWQVGAEHTTLWWQAIVCGKSEPGEIKSHFIRFLGTYNILNLLVFTIGMAFMIAERPPETPTDMAIWAIDVVMTGASGVGCVASTVFYATVSPVSDVNFLAFAKRPTVFAFCRFCNDCSIAAIVVAGVWTFAQAYRVVVERSTADGAAHGDPWSWLALGWPVLVACTGVALLMARMLYFVGLITNTTLFAGLFAGTVITPDGDHNWAHHASPEDVEEYIARTAVWQTRRRATFAKDTLEMYRKNAHRKLQVGHSHAARRQAGGDGHGDGGGLFSAQTGDGGGESSMKQRRGRVSVSG